MKRHINWRTFHGLCEELADKIAHAKFKSVYGYPRGGLIPATIISHYLNIPLITELDENAGVYETILIDDIADSGKTLKALDHKVRTATLFVNKNRCKYYPDFFVEETSNWIVFPYEYDNDSVSEVSYKPRRYT
jgi:hypoxanthine phosphoribosyltransferase